MNIKVVRCFVAFPLLVSSVVFAFEGGTGNAGDPFRISTAQQLDSLRFFCGIAHSEKNFELINDIDLSVWLSQGNPGYDNGSFWRPIGDSVQAFCGKLDGNHHKITGLKIDRRSAKHTGLFGCLQVNGLLKNTGIEIKNGDTVWGGYYTGGLVGSVNAATIRSCYCSGVVIGNYPYVGGLVGSIGSGSISDCYASGTVNDLFSIAGGLVGSSDSGTIDNCHATGNVNGVSDIGGLVGYQDSNGTITSSFTNVVVNGTELWAGGLVGANEGTIQNCHAAGEVGTQGHGRGGLVGVNFKGTVKNSFAAVVIKNNGDDVGGLIGTNRGTVIGCYATGTVRGRWYAGGLVGRNEDSGTMTNCYATGAVSSNLYVGGLTGGNDDDGKMTNCYATGAVNCDNNGGGLLGMGISGTVVGCYWDKQTTGYDTSTGSDRTFAKTTAELKTQSTFVMWDFASTWAIANDRNNGYPCLQWQLQSGIVHTPLRVVSSVYLFLYCRGGRLFLSAPLPAGAILNLFEPNGRLLYRSEVCGVSIPLPPFSTRGIVLWQIRESKKPPLSGSMLIEQ